MEVVVKLKSIDDCGGCRKKIAKLLKKLEVDTFRIDAENGRVIVIGHLDKKDHILQAFRKKFPKKDPKLDNDNRDNATNNRGNDKGNGRNSGSDNRGNGNSKVSNGNRSNVNNGKNKGGKEIASSSGCGNGNNNGGNSNGGKNKGKEILASSSGNGGGESGNQVAHMGGHQPMGMNHGYYPAMSYNAYGYGTLSTNYEGPPPPMPPPQTSFYANPPHTYFSDENTNGCSIM